MPLVNPSTVQNPTTGQVASAAWGDAVDDAITYVGGGFPHASILESTPQSINTATYTALTSNEENSDIGGMHSTVSNTERITIPASEGGLYDLTATVSFAVNATGVRAFGFGKNSVTPTYNVASVDACAVDVTSLSGAQSMVLVAGDYLTCSVYHTKGSALNCTMNDFTVKWRATA